MKQQNGEHRVSAAGRQTFSAGFTLVEVMISLVVLSIGLMGGVGTLQWTERSLQQSLTSTRALSLAEARLEAKQAGMWEQLLIDDMDHDGVPDIVMQDAGLRDDLIGGDGVYTAAADLEGIHLVWTVEPNRSGPIKSAGTVWIEVRARYETKSGQSKEIRLRTLRANPRYVGGLS
jgi:prepilin-type N-terminal cleavage/methylation domain-containing protein